MEPILQGKSEIDQLAKIFELVGVPTEESWPTFRELPNAKSLNFPRNKQTYPPSHPNHPKKKKKILTLGISPE